MWFAANGLSNLIYLVLSGGKDDCVKTRSKEKMAAGYTCVEHCHAGGVYV